MSVVGNQRRILLELLGRLRPHGRHDAALPARLERLLRQNRRWGSRDRRLYRERIYTTWRYLSGVEPLLASSPDRAVDLIAWLAADTPDTRDFRAASYQADPAASASEAALAVPPPPTGFVTFAAKVDAAAPLIGTLPASCRNGSATNARRPLRFPSTKPWRAARRFGCGSRPTIPPPSPPSLTPGVGPGGGADFSPAPSKS